MTVAPPVVNICNCVIFLSSCAVLAPLRMVYQNDPHSLLKYFFQSRPSDGQKHKVSRFVAATVNSATYGQN